MERLQTNSRWLAITMFAVTVGLGGCAPGDPEAANTADTAEEQTGSQAEALTIEVGRNAVAYDFAARNDIVHGVAGDTRFVFVTEALAGRVVVLDRFTGHQVGTLPAPPGGFRLPFTLRVPRTGRLVVLDPGGFPSPTEASIAKVYDYDYSWNAARHEFRATLARTVSFAGLPVVFAEDVEVLPDGRYVMSESVIGALWMIHTDGSIAPALLPASFAPGEGIPLLSPCAFPVVQVDGVPFTTFGNFAPGVGSLANHNGNLYFGNTCSGGVYRVPVAALEDPTRSPDQRAADIRVVSARATGVTEAIKGLAFNRWDSHDDRLYATDPLHLRVIRINVTTGAREVIADEEGLFDFPVSAQFLPPVAGLSPLVVASDQEYRLAALNAAITEDVLHPPFVIAKVYIRR